MTKLPQFSGLSAKRIPTLVGLVILVIALILGTVFFQQGLGVFAPRATPETTPKQVRITNVSESSFTISFMTEAEVAGFVKYGTEENGLKKTAVDDRDALTSTIGKFKLHHITLRSLEPNTTYYYVLGTGDGALFDNNGIPFKLVTARRSGSPSAAKTVHGSVTTESGAPAEGAIVFVTIDGAGEMSSLVKNAGGWAVPLSNARTPDGSAYAKISDDTTIQILVQGPTTGQTARGMTTVAEAQPVPTLSYGQTAIVAASATDTEADMPADTTQSAEETVVTAQTAAEDTASDSASSRRGSSTVLADTTTASSSSTSVTETPEAKVVDLTTPEEKTVTTTQPTITGQAAPNVTVTIEVHSDTQLTHQLIANADGSFSLNIAELKKELEPGEHSVTYSYTDPTTGKPVTKTETFYVEPQNATATLAQAAASPRVSPSPSPYGTNNPFPIQGSTTSANSSNASRSGTATDSGRSSKPATGSGLPVSGSVGTTLALIFGGLFFIISGAWSFWVSKQYSQEKAE